MDLGAAFKPLAALLPPTLLDLFRLPLFTDFATSTTSAPLNRSAPDPSSALPHVFPTAFPWRVSEMIPSLEPADWASILLSPALYYIYCSFYYFLSKARFTTAELHRLPSDQPGRKPNRITVRHVVLTCILQHIIQIAAATTLAIVTKPPPGVVRNMEEPLIAALKIIGGMITLDSYEYWVHRLMHENRWLYKNFHSVHHQLTVPYAFGALYNHPVEGFVLDTVGGGLSSLLFDMHPWTATIFYVISTMKTVDDHCGYAFPWHPFHVLFPNNSKFHDIHHWGKGIRYNYSQPFFTWWDYLMGTEFESAMRRKAAKRAAEGKEGSSSEEEEVVRKVSEESSLRRRGNASGVVQEDHDDDERRHEEDVRKLVEKLEKEAVNGIKMKEI